VSDAILDSLSQEVEEWVNWFLRNKGLNCHLLIQFSSSVYVAGYLVSDACSNHLNHKNPNQSKSQAIGEEYNDEEYSKGEDLENYESGVSYNE